MNALWHITLFGGLCLQQAEHTITRFRTQKTASLLSYLAYHLCQVHSREALIDLFWSESSLESGRASLSVALSSLRHQLEPPGTPTHSILRADRFSISLNPAAVATDVAEFESAIGAASHSQNSTEREQALARAVERYSGHLLPNFYDDWITGEQERLSSLFFDAVGRLITLLEERGDFRAALPFARKAVSMDPLREEMHFYLIRLLAAAGQMGAALRQYKEWERLLDTELGEEPSAALRAFVRQFGKESELSALAPSSSVTVLPTPCAAAQQTAPMTLTFLLTDIEDSTRLRERNSKAFQQTFALHHAILRQEFGRYGGQEGRETGDSLQVSFASARQALSCAVACQEALASQTWQQETGQLPARMALHTGDVEPEQGGEQGGATLHRAGRILTAAHGGQILCSQTTAELVNRNLGENLQLTDLGVFRLRDVSLPERLFQVEYPGMQQRQFPLPSAEAGYQSHLPLTFTRFFGRERELALIKEQLVTSDTRLMTITGIGGNGKTRLALRAAEQLEQAFAGAVWFVALADLADPQRIADAILDKLRVSRSPQKEPLDQVVEALNRQPSLLVLDNCEHLIEGATQSVQTLLERVPTLTILVTSRQLLNLSAEREFASMPLLTPNGGETPEQLSLFESVQLFVDRAQAVKPDFQVTNHNAPAVAELCQKLEGIPLAIELAATRSLTMTPLYMLSQLEQRFTFLVSRKRDAASRHRTLHAAVDWSFQLLAPELQRFFTWLSVFRDGWTVEAAEAVCEEPLALDYLAQLCDCSLIFSEESDGAIRFRMLETLREYAHEHLAPGEHIVSKQRHLAHFLCKVEQGDAVYSVRLEGVFWSDPHNFRAALQWARTGGDTRAGLRMSGMFGHAWWWTGLLREAIEHLTDLLSREELQEATVDRARALYLKGWIVTLLGDVVDACALYKESLQIYHQINHKRGIARTLCALGDTVRRCGKHEEARAYLEESLTLFRVIGDTEGTGAALNDLGDLALRLGNSSEARRFFGECGAISGTWSLRLLKFAEIALLEGDYAKARRLAEEDAAGRQSSPQRLGEAPLIVASAAMYQNDLPLAYSQCRESLVQFHKIGSKLFITKVLRRFAYLAVMQKQRERAVQLLGADAFCCETLGMPLPPCESDEYWRNTEAARQKLGGAAFAAAWERGRAMTWEQAVAYALEENGRA